MAFKMKRTPIKGKLDNFFSSLGKEATSARQTKQKASNTGEYAGMTNFEKRRAEKKSRKPGESKFQADIRRRGEANKSAKAKKKLKPGEFTTKQKLEGKLVPNQELMNKKVKVAEKPKKVIKTNSKKVVEKKTDFTKVKGSTTYVKPKKTEVKSKKKADGTLNLDPVLDLNKKTSKKYKAPKKRANIFSSGLDLAGKYLNKLDRAIGFKTVPNFMKKYDE